MTRIIRRFKYFTILDYDKEEIYLRKMHSKGYKFVKVVLPGIYTFEVTEPLDTVYKLDFMDGDMCLEDKLDYLQIFKDNGWEVVTTFMGYSYFRKNASSTNTEIFSEDETKLEMIKKIYRRRVLPLTIIFGAVVVPNAIEVLNNKTIISQNPFHIFSLVVFVIYLLLFINLILGYFRITKKIKNMV